jgi:hypothetical protein
MLNWGFAAFKSNLSAGSHTFKLQWKVTNASNGATLKATSSEKPTLTVLILKQ